MARHRKNAPAIDSEKLKKLLKLTFGNDKHSSNIRIVAPNTSKSVITRILSGSGNGMGGNTFKEFIDGLEGEMERREKEKAKINKSISKYRSELKKFEKNVEN